jgi:HEAT repeat protein
MIVDITALFARKDISPPIHLLRDPDLSIRRDAALALAGMGGVAVQPMIHALRREIQRCGYGQQQS